VAASEPRATDPLILVVEDDPALLSTLRGVLGSGGYRVWAAESGSEARATLEHLEPDLILLDLMLPDTDGLILAATLKTLRSTPIIIMSARNQQADRVLGLKLGADDFVSKPFELDELMARVEAVLRRATRTPAPADPITIGDLTITPTRALVTLGATAVRLTPTEYRLLLALARHVDEIVSRQALLQLVWGYQDSGARHVIDVCLGRLRQKIRRARLATPRIITVRGAGFKLVSEPAPDRGPSVAVDPGPTR
jgi:DNA-binding response OmpR family regulator